MRHRVGMLPTRCDQSDSILMAGAGRRRLTASSRSRRWSMRGGELPATRADDPCGLRAPSVDGLPLPGRAADGSSTRLDRRLRVAVPVQVRPVVRRDAFFAAVFAAARSPARCVVVFFVVVFFVVAFFAVAAGARLADAFFAARFVAFF